MSESEQSSDEDRVYEGPVRPYMFEPMADAAEVVAAECVGRDVSLSASSKATDFNTVSSWCACNNCEVMESPAECVCCQSIAAVKGKCEEVSTAGLGPTPACIVQHPGFSSVCLDVWVLQAVYNEYKQRYGHIEKSLHERYRYCAYRHLVRWCWGYIGKHHRVVFPACAVTAIRRRFPAENYTGFQLPPVDSD